MSEEKRILQSYHTVAIVGISASPEKPSFTVGKYLKEHGYRVIPVNPKEAEILGEKAYPDLSSIPEKLEVVDVFRKPEDIPAIAREAVKIGARVLWMQEGIVSEEAAGIAREGGLEVVMDRCMRQQHIKLLGE